MQRLSSIQLTTGPSKNFLSHTGTPCVSSPPHSICHIGTSSYLAQSSYLVRNSNSITLGLRSPHQNGGTKRGFPALRCGQVVKLFRKLPPKVSTSKHLRLILTDFRLPCEAFPDETVAILVYRSGRSSKQPCRLGRGLRILDKIIVLKMLETQHRSVRVLQ